MNRCLNRRTFRSPLSARPLLQARLVAEGQQVEVQTSDHPYRQDSDLLATCSRTNSSINTMHLRYSEH